MIALPCRQIHISTIELA